MTRYTLIVRKEFSTERYSLDLDKTVRHEKGDIILLYETQTASVTSVWYNPSRDEMNVMLFTEMSVTKEGLLRCGWHA